MPRITAWAVRGLTTAVIFGTVANAQSPVIQRAPVPRQVLTAKTAIIGNGGSETYGADSYFHLTKYDGGPDRAYNAFYNAVQGWGHYDLVGSTSDADVLLVIKFTNPIVDREQTDAATAPNDWIYDPQLNLSISDPRTGLSLWTITEHIEPGSDRAADNRHFDEAVARVVDDLERLILHPEVSATLENNALPPGAIAAAQRRQREEHAGIGFLLGMAVGGLLAAHSVDDSCPDLNNIAACSSRAGAKMRNEMVGTVGGAIVGALVGWIWPVRF